MTRATVEDRTAGVGQSLRTGRPLVGGFSFHGVSGLCPNSLAHGQPGGIQSQGMRQAADAGQLPVIRTPWGGAQCGEQCGPDLEHSETKQSKNKNKDKDKDRDKKNKNTKTQKHKKNHLELWTEPVVRLLIVVFPSWCRGFLHRHVVISSLPLLL